MYNQNLSSMSSDDQILDQSFSKEIDEHYIEKNKASGGKRFLNSIIDTIVYYILLFVFGFLLSLITGNEEAALTYVGLSVYLIYPLYYWIMESTTGKTVGKYITKTKVVKADGSKPTALNILGRTFCRFIPFDAFSYLGNSVIGWHDSIPKVYVIEEN